uniref:Uncharacterized protein n=1 Tax=Pavo cristatus TaxID=9049 RepID=A0A8C9FP40_PAVCR
MCHTAVLPLPWGRHSLSASLLSIFLWCHEIYNKTACVFNMLGSQLFIIIVLCFLYCFSYSVAGQQNPQDRDYTLAVSFPGLQDE